MERLAESGTDVIESSGEQEKQPSEGVSDSSAHSALDTLIDPSRREPLADPDTFAEILRGMVADYAPRMFAVVQEYGDRVDARIAAWGMAFEDHAFAVSEDSSTRHEADSPEDILFVFGLGAHVQPHIVWVDPTAATPPEEAD
jgi:hypothetical protein